MKKLCLGTFLRILSDTKLQTQKQGALIFCLLSIVHSDDRFEDQKFHSALLSGKNNLAGYEDITAFDKEKLIAKFESNIKPLFNEDGQRLAIVCIRDVIKEDASILDSTNIGFEDKGYTKQDIVNKQVFPFSELMANVYFYCCTQVLNIPYKDNIKEIKDYAKAQIGRIGEIQLETESTYVQSKVKLTLNPQPFSGVFTEISDLKLSIANSNEVKIYRLDVVDSKIDYERLQRYILNNIGNYIYCRGKRNRYNLPEDSASLAMDSLRSYKKRVKTDPSSNHFNEIMLYSFLECVLGAPKVFSKMELQDHSGVFDSSSSGIHILTLKQGGKLFNQMVFGASDTMDTLESAVNNALSQVVNIKSNINDEYNLVKEDVLSCRFDAETNKALEDIIIPKKSGTPSKPDSAFGLFLGYSVDIPEEPNNYKYKTNLEAKMDDDIKKIAPYIKNKIVELRLNNYSFYIYILPLNNAGIDKELIMKSALEVDI